MASQTKETTVANVFGTMRDIWRHLSSCRKKQFFLLSGIALFGGLGEAISLGLIVPFLAAMAAPEKVLSHAISPTLILVFNKLASWFGASLKVQQTDPQGLLLLLAYFFICAALLTGFVRLALNWMSARLSAAVGTDLGVEVYRRTLYQPYSVHVSRNSSHLISSLTTKITLTTLSMHAFLNLLISFLIILFLAGALVLVDPLVTLTAGGGLGVAYGILTLANHKKLAACSHVISRENNQIMKSLQEGFGGIRDILLDGTQWLYEKLYQKADTAFRRAYANSTILAYSPRYIMETVGMVIFALLGLAMSQRSGGLAMALPTLGALAMGVQRLLPALQQAYQAWSTILAYQQSNQEVVELLGQPLPTWANLPQPAPLLFRQEIRFEDVKFCFSEDGLWVLDGLSLIISKGSRVGFIGKTGSGKSTCLDLLMGLLEPTEGRILIDGVPLTHKNLRAWQRNIAHVPQIIYLSDGTLAENIAFGIPSEKIEMNRVREAASQAQIAEFIDSSPKGYQTLIGERGIRLSGGQRQRIGIARALYKEAEILVFDEATSALDRETEEAVMQSIGSLSADLTILIVAHRTSTLKNCTQIIHLGKNQGL